MNKIIFAIMPWLFAAIGYKATAQDIPKPPEPPKESQEIIIRKKGEKDARVTIEFKDDKVLINGKPMVEFKDDAITINNRTFKFKQLEKDFEGFGKDMEQFGREMELAFGGDNFKGMMGKSGSFLGVVTEKVDAGAEIKEVVKGSAAEKAGLQAGDIITKVDDTKVNGPAELAEIIEKFEPKKEVKIHYKRDGKDKTSKATLQERKMSEARSFSITAPDGGIKSYAIPRAPGAPRAPRQPGAAPMPPGNFEFDIDEFKMDGNFNRRPKLGLKIQDLEEGPGVKVLEVEEGSAAAIAGLKKDDIITEIGAVKVKNTDEVREQLMENSNKNAYPIVAKRNNTEMKFEVKIPKKLKTANL
ncbi:MAG TPA: PDZ domain-containing protein [Ferruginibacter sp.]|nr:PDZ domain-containing protein [Ferruginibacter sp.]